MAGIGCRCGLSGDVCRGWKGVWMVFAGVFHAGPSARRIPDAALPPAAPGLSDMEAVFGFGCQPVAWYCWSK